MASYKQIISQLHTFLQKSVLVSDLIYSGCQTNLYMTFPTNFIILSEEVCEFCGIDLSLCIVPSYCLLPKRHFVSVPPEVHFLLQGFYFIEFCFPVYFHNMVVVCLIWVEEGSWLGFLWGFGLGLFGFGLFFVLLVGFGVFFLWHLFYCAACQDFLFSLARCMYFIVISCLNCSNVKKNEMHMFYTKQKHVAFILLGFMYLIVHCYRSELYIFYTG